MQLLLAWRQNKWVLLRDNVEVGAYAYRTHAMERVRTLAAEIFAQGLDCYLLYRDQDAVWRERPCPRPIRRAVAA